MQAPMIENSTDTTPLALYGSLPGAPPLRAGGKREEAPAPAPAKLRPLPLLRAE